MTSICFFQLVKRAAHLSKLLEHEFILTPPCGSLEAKIHQTVDNLVVMGLLVDAGVSVFVFLFVLFNIHCTVCSGNHMQICTFGLIVLVIRSDANLISLQTQFLQQKTGSRWIEDSDEEDVSYSQCYKVSPSTAILEVIGAWRYMLTPMLDAYYCTACNLQMLVGRQVPDVKFIQNTQSYINDLLQKGSLRYGK